MSLKLCDIRKVTAVPGLAWKCSDIETDKVKRTTLHKSFTPFREWGVLFKTLSTTVQVYVTASVTGAYTKQFLWTDYDSTHLSEVLPVIKPATWIVHDPVIGLRCKDTWIQFGSQCVRWCEYIICYISDVTDYHCKRFLFVGFLAKNVWKDKRWVWNTA